MTKPALALAATGLAAGLAILPSTAAAQNKVSEIVVFGDDPCPRSTDDEVVVCARKPETERYRIPEEYRSQGPRAQRQSWASRATEIQTVGATGINSCSPVGPAGFTGCLDQVIRQARRESAEAADQATAPEE